MNNYLALTNALIKNTFRPLSKNNKHSNKSIIFFLLIGLSMLPLEIGLVLFVSTSYNLLHSINQEGLILGLGLSTVSSVIFFFGIFYIISVFYFSKDIENFLPIPLKPSEIIGAKFTLAIIFEYITEIMFFLPIMITFGVISGSGLVYYFYVLLIFLCLPIVPLILASFIVMIIMSLTNLFKNKDKFKLFGGILAIFSVVSLNVFIQRYVNTMSKSQLLQLLLQGHNSTVGLTSKLFFSARFGTESLLNYNNFNGLLNLLIFFAVNIIFLVLFVLLGNVLYFKGAIGSTEVTKNKRSSKINIYNEVLQKPVLISYISKELKLLFRTPIYFMNCVLMNFIWPIFVFIPIMFQPNFSENLEKVKYILQTTNSDGIIVVIMLAAGTFLCASNGITSTAISREGQNISICKYLPMMYENQILAKVFSGAIMGFVGYILLLITSVILFRPSIYLLVTSFIVGILGIFTAAFTGIIIDLNYPKLIWDNEQKAVKQNLNFLLNMLVSVLISGIIIFLVIKLKPSLELSFVTIVVIFSLINIMLYKITKVKGKILFQNIEI